MSCLRRRRRATFWIASRSPICRFLGGGKSAVREEGLALRGLGLANAALICDLQGRARQKVATIDIDATI